LAQSTRDSLSCKEPALKQPWRLVLVLGARANDLKSSLNGINALVVGYRKVTLLLL